jgi:phosphatidylethanolamine/phosphatidyl-N-methylethanolamine N-methyltransferase
VLTPSSRPDHRKSYDRPIEARLPDEARFFRSWLENPMIAGAVSPSGRYLARMMANYVDPHGSGPIIELGPGTGAITDALLKRGVAPGRLILVEFDRGFCKLLERRFPGVRVVQGDAYHLSKTLGSQLESPAEAIVSSLPLLMKPEAQRLVLLADGFRCLQPEGCFIQFTYGPASPMPRDHAALQAFHVEASRPVWLNIPPARVWVYRRNESGVASHDGGKRLNPASDFFDMIRAGTEKMQIGLQKEIDGARARLRLKPTSAQPLRKGGGRDHKGRPVRHAGEHSKTHRS